MTTEPAFYDEKITPAIVLAGKKWPVPELAPRQLREARRLIIDVQRALDPVVDANSEEDERRALQERQACAETAEALGAIDAANAIRARSDKPLAPKIVEDVGERIVNMTTEIFNKMCDVVYYGLTRAHPTMQREEFEDMPITDLEMYMAFLVVRTQANIFVTSGASAPGEVKAMESQTGTE